MNIRYLVDRLITLQNNDDDDGPIFDTLNIDVFTPGGIRYNIDNLIVSNGYVEIYLKKLGS